MGAIKKRVGESHEQISGKKKERKKTKKNQRLSMQMGDLKGVK